MPKLNFFTWHSDHIRHSPKSNLPPTLSACLRVIENKQHDTKITPEKLCHRPT